MSRIIRNWTGCLVIIALIKAIIITFSPADAGVEGPIWYGIALIGFMAFAIASSVNEDKKAGTHDTRNGFILLVVFWIGSLLWRGGHPKD